MKILLLTGSVNQGGAEFQLLALANLLQQKGYDVEVLALTNYSYYLPYINQNNLSYSCISNEGGNIKRIYRSVSAIKKIKPDLVISYIRATSLVAIIARVAVFFRFKLIISERTSLILPKYDFVYFNLALLANKITVNSVSKCNYIKKRFPYLKNRTVFVPNIIDINKYNNNTKKEYDPRCIHLGCVGRISPEKNLLNLVKAVLLLLDKKYPLQLTFIGQTNNTSHLKELQTLISHSSHAQHFDIAGPSDNMVQSYAKMDLLCHVSFYEGFSNVIAEAMCAGLPVIGSDIEEISFFVKDGENGFLVDPHSSAAIANGIEKFIQLSNEKRVSLAENSTKRSTQLFDNELVVDQYADLFSSINLR